MVVYKLDCVVVYCCLIFNFQVLYLDSIDTGCLNMEHNVLPRVMLFGQK